MWRMPIESAPHERTWMAFPREGVTLGDDAETREDVTDQRNISRRGVAREGAE